MSTPGRYGDGRGSHGLSLLPQDVPAAVAAIRAGTASAAVRLAVEFVILTGCRSGEARHATWDTIDNDTWTLPGERTKTGKPNRIPLSRRAPEVLAEARRLGDGTGLVFGVARTGRPLSDNTLGKALRSTEIPATVHAMRASLRDWLAAEGVPEPPWYSWRVGLLVSNRLLVGSSGSVGRFELCGRGTAQVGVEPPVVVPATRGTDKGCDT